MVDTCLHAVEWTLLGNTTRIEKNQSISKDKDSIFIRGKCEEQKVRLNYIFNDDSSFQIDDANLNLKVQAFTEKCQVDGEEEEGSKADDSQLQITIAWTVAGATTFAMLTVFVSICLFVRHKRRNMMKIDVNDGVYGTYYEGRVEYSTVEVSSERRLYAFHH